jgi:hypothetical protein
MTVLCGVVKMKCKINNDDWFDIGIVYTILSYSTRLDTTAVRMLLQHPDGTITDRTVAHNQIEWIK